MVDYTPRMVLEPGGGDSKPLTPLQARKGVIPEFDQAEEFVKFFRKKIVDGLTPEEMKNIYIKALNVILVPYTRAKLKQVMASVPPDRNWGRTGNLSASIGPYPWDIEKKVSGNYIVIKFGTPFRYGFYMEKGTGVWNTKTNTPIMRKNGAAMHWQDGKGKWYHAFVVSGMAPRPWLESSISEKRKDISKYVLDGMAKLLRKKARESK